MYYLIQIPGMWDRLLVSFSWEDWPVSGRIRILNQVYLILNTQLLITILCSLTQLKLNKNIIISLRKNKK